MAEKAAVMAAETDNDETSVKRKNFYAQVLTKLDEMAAPQNAPSDTVNAAFGQDKRGRDIAVRAEIKARTAETKTAAAFFDLLNMQDKTTAKRLATHAANYAVSTMFVCGSLLESDDYKALQGISDAANVKIAEVNETAKTSYNKKVEDAKNAAEEELHHIAATYEELLTEKDRKAARQRREELETHILTNFVNDPSVKETGKSIDDAAKEKKNTIIAEEKSNVERYMKAVEKKIKNRSSLNMDELNAALKDSGADLQKDDRGKALTRFVDAIYVQYMSITTTCRNLHKCQTFGTLEKNRAFLTKKINKPKDLSDLLTVFSVFSIPIPSTTPYLPSEYLPSEPKDPDLLCVNITDLFDVETGANISAELLSKIPDRDLRSLVEGALRDGSAAAWNEAFTQLRVIILDLAKPDNLMDFDYLTSAVLLKELRPECITVDKKRVGSASLRLLHRVFHSVSIARVVRYITCAITQIVSCVTLSGISKEAAKDPNPPVCLASNTEVVADLIYNGKYGECLERSGLLKPGTIQYFQGDRQASMELAKLLTNPSEIASIADKSIGFATTREVVKPLPSRSLSAETAGPSTMSSFSETASASASALASASASASATAPALPFQARRSGLMLATPSTTATATPTPTALPIPFPEPSATVRPTAGPGAYVTKETIKEMRPWRKLLTTVDPSVFAEKKASMCAEAIGTQVLNSVITRIVIYLRRIWKGAVDTFWSIANSKVIQSVIDYFSRFSTSDEKPNQEQIETISNVITGGVTEANRSLTEDVLQFAKDFGNTVVDAGTYAAGKTAEAAKEFGNTALDAGTYVVGKTAEAAKYVFPEFLVDGLGLTGRVAADAVAGAGKGVLMVPEAVGFAAGTASDVTKVAAGLTGMGEGTFGVAMALQQMAGEQHDILGLLNSETVQAKMRPLHAETHKPWNEGLSARSSGVISFAAAKLMGWTWNIAKLVYAIAKGALYTVDFVRRWSWLFGSLAMIGGNVIGYFAPGAISVALLAAANLMWNTFRIGLGPNFVISALRHAAEKGWFGTRARSFIKNPITNLYIDTLRDLVFIYAAWNGIDIGPVGTICAFPLTNIFRMWETLGNLPAFDAVTLDIPEGVADFQRGTIQVGVTLLSKGTKVVSRGAEAAGEYMGLTKGVATILAGTGVGYALLGKVPEEWVGGKLNTRVKTAGGLATGVAAAITASVAAPVVAAGLGLAGTAAAVNYMMSERTVAGTVTAAKAATGAASRLFLKRTREDDDQWEQTGGAGIPRARAGAGLGPRRYEFDPDTRLGGRAFVVSTRFASF